MKVFKFFMLFNFSSIYFKKLLSIFLISIFLFGGFIPKNQEFKDNFISALNCAINTVKLSFVDECMGRIFSITDVITGNVLKFLDLGELTQYQISNNENDKKNNKESVPVNTSNNNCILPQQNLGNLNNFVKTKILCFYSINMYLSSLYVFYDNVKLCQNKTATDIWILLFILFSIFTVKIKDIVVNNNILTYKIEPAWL